MMTTKSESVVLFRRYSVTLHNLSQSDSRDATLMNANKMRARRPKKMAKLKFYKM